MLLVFIVITIIGVFLFMQLSPEFGGKISDDQEETFKASSQYSEGKFHNPGNVRMEMSFSKMTKIAKAYFNPQENTVPENSMPIVRNDAAEINNYAGPARLVWFGHSAFLLQIDAKNILIDPMFGDVPSPHPWLGTKRFSDGLPIEIQQLPKIDAVLFSHDHYDHLDYGSIKKIKDKVAHFYVPLGLGAHLKAWEVPEDQITEMDWWDTTSFKDLKIIAAPAQHFSGRGFGDRDNTLWASWIIQGKTDNIYFSGDSGYGDHFKQIGATYGPFDFAMIECGQYNKHWKEIHMMPEESAQAAKDVNARVAMPIHWAAFKLALHPWTDPVVRFLEKAKELNLKVVTPKIGEKIIIKEPAKVQKWW
ncbi:MBL fold metallo-hydrolase [Gramella sp. AN32]|uniref:MBL fold metallo-hydrolase n=1 Tax=Christiangramia antarctica TaxID=2058158 RepID=A0ABW5X2Z7_9FLAO|nr:MBL fold metallo-hydrolase [Gramella sp. AN32]